MQPYFFPYAGYFSMIALCDRFILFDLCQFNRKSWIVRNRLSSEASNGWSYINLRVKKAPLDTAISQMFVDDHRFVFDKLRSQISDYPCRPNYLRRQFVLGLIDEVEAKITSRAESSSISLSTFNQLSLDTVLKALYIKVPVTVASVNGYEIGDIQHSGQWALEICKCERARTYINPISGRHLFDENEFSDCGLALNFFDYSLTVASKVLGDKSVLDVLMQFDRDYVSECIFESANQGLVSS